MKRGKMTLLGIVSLLSFSLVVRDAHGALLGIDFDTGKLYSISTVDASLSLIGSTGIANVGALEFSPGGTLYGFTVGSSSTLYTINPSTASTTPVGSLGLSFVFEGGLAFAPNGTAYGTNAGSAGAPLLFSINLGTGAATSIGTISGGSHDIDGLAFRSDSMLVGLDRVTNSLLAINPATAASSVILAISPTVGAVGGMTAVGDSGFFSTSGPGGSFPGSNELYSFNLFTGANTLVGSFGPTIQGNGVSGLATSPAAVPEPPTVLLLGSGLVGLAGIAWRRRRRR